METSLKLEFNWNAERSGSNEIIINENESQPQRLRNFRREPIQIKGMDAGWAQAPPNFFYRP